MSETTAKPRATVPVVLHPGTFSLGTDAHTPESLRENADELAAFVDRWDIDPAVIQG